MKKLALLAVSSLFLSGCVVHTNAYYPAPVVHYRSPPVFYHNPPVIYRAPPVIVPRYHAPRYVPHHHYHYYRR